MCLFFCPSFSLNKRHHILSHFSGKGIEKDNRVKGCKSIQSPPLPAPSVCLQHMQASVKPGTEKTTSRLMAGGGFDVRSGRCFLGSYFLCVGAINGCELSKGATRHSCFIPNTC